MPPPTHHPIAIGGVGGSGTRVIAELVGALGYEMGNDLNAYRDNLSFTLLFMRPWRFTYADGLVEADNPRAALVARMLRDTMTHGGLTPRYLSELAMAVADTGLRGNDAQIVSPKKRSAKFRTRWATTRALSISKNLSSRAAAPSDWGWKAPNTFIFLPALHRDMPELRYVHVVRNGLDMAFSKNDRQNHLWGNLYGVSEFDEDKAKAKLVYWARANMRVVRYIDSLEAHTGAAVNTAASRRAHVVRYEDATERPAETLAALCEALGIPSTAEAEKLAASLEPASTVGRHLEHDHDDLVERGGEEVREALQHFGY